MKKIFCIFVVLFFIQWTYAQQRVIYTINDGWKFNKTSLKKVQLSNFDDSLLGESKYTTYLEQ